MLARSLTASVVVVLMATTVPVFSQEIRVVETPKETISRLAGELTNVMAQVDADQAVNCVARNETVQEIEFAITCNIVYDSIVLEALPALVALLYADILIAGGTDPEFVMTTLDEVVMVPDVLRQILVDTNLEYTRPP